MEILLLAAFIGLIPAAIANSKGYSFASWWVFGALLFIVALPVAMCLEPNNKSRRQCPHCRTWIDRQASVCAQCSRDVPPWMPTTPSELAGRTPYEARRRPWEDGR